MPGVGLTVNEGSVQAIASAMDSSVRSTTLSHIISAHNVSHFQLCLTPLSHLTGSTNTPILLFRIQSGHDMYLPRRRVPPDLLHGERTRKPALSPAKSASDRQAVGRCDHRHLPIFGKVEGEATSCGEPAE